MEELQQQTELINRSALFDPSWYLAQYPDVARLGMDPVVHYLRIGAQLLRNPGPDFDTAFYLRAYTDVALAQINPLVHYIAFGQKEQRLPLPPTKASTEDMALIKEAFSTGIREVPQPAAAMQAQPQPPHSAAMVDAAALRVGVFVTAAAIRNDLADLRAALEHIGDYALYVVADEDQPDELKRLIARHFAPLELVLLPYADSSDQATIQALRRMHADGVQVTCFITHSNALGDASWLNAKLRRTWFKRALAHLLGGAGQVCQILDAFRANPKLGLVGPALFYKPVSARDFPDGSVLVEALAQSGQGVHADADWSAFAGAMFWARLDSFASLLGKPETGLHQRRGLEVALARSGKDFEQLAGLLPRVAAMQTAVVHTLTLGDESIFLEIVEPAANPYRKSLERTLIQEHRLAADSQLVADSELFDPAHYLAQIAPEGWHTADPILHYLRFGEDFGYEPSLRFNGARYLRYNPDVAASSLNPLVHYLRFGTQAARTLFFDPVSTPKDRGVRILVSCWLKNKESLHDGLAELAERLRLQGVHAIFVTNARPLIQDPRLSVLASNFLLSDCDATIPEMPSQFPPWLAEIAAIELRWLETMATPQEKREPAALVRSTRRAYVYWKSVLEQARPAMMLVWGSTAPLSKLHLRICQELAIPTLVLERGHFPRCFSVDLLGQFAYGGVNLKPHTALPVVRGGESGRVAARIDWVRTCTEVAYANSNHVQDIAAALEAYRSAGRKIVLFIGVNDLGSGSAYAFGDIVERHSFLYNSSLEAFRAVRKAIELVDPSAVLILKPHPSDRHDYGREESEQVVLAKDWDINKLIGQVDACLAMSTTALARALVESTPIVSLGLSDLSIKGMTYECHSLTDLPVMLRSALIRENFTEMQEKGFAYLNFLFDEQLVGIAADVPTAFHVERFSEYLVKRIDAYTPPELRHSGDVGAALRANRDPRRNVFFQEAYPALLGPGLPFQHTVDVVIPVYGDAVITKDCIESVLESQDKVAFRVIIICDKSPYPDVVEMVDSYQDRDNVVVLHNANNLGYPGTANRGMAYSHDRDVIVLNSDTLVAKGWVDRLQAHAFNGYNVATVTPMSNNASIFSCRNHPQGSELAGGLAEVERINELFRRRDPITVEVPVGHGFCMYIKRACMRTVGFFDEITFGRGYSEEVDFCLRARQAGFVNVCGTDVYVGHVGGVSFAETANTRKTAARKIIRERYPMYFSEISEFLITDPLKEYRNYE